MAGPMRRMMRLTPGSLKPQRGQVKNPIFAKKGNWKPSCTKPAASTPQARATTWSPSGRRGANHRAEAIMHKFRNTGVKAGIAKRL